MDMTSILFLVAIVIVGALFLVIMAVTKHAPHHVDRARYQADWLKIENNLSRDEPSSHILAVLNADKLLDRALRESHYQGQTMGDRLKSAQNKWSNTNEIWEAHKLRNRLAHETGVSVSYDEAKRALVGFKRALKDLGAI